MTGLLGELQANIDRIEPAGLLSALFLAGLVEVLFPPFPGDAVFALGGFVAGRRGFPLLWPLLAACAGTYLAASGLYLAGRLWGRSLLDKGFFARLLPAREQRRLEGWFARYGLLVILGSRFVPVVRSGIALAAGIAAVPPGRGLAILAAGVVAFDSLLVLGGHLMGENWRALAASIGVLGWAIGAAGLLVVFCRVLGRRRGR